MQHVFLEGERSAHALCVRASVCVSTRARSQQLD
jgi:hypothetical protein